MHSVRSLSSEDVRPGRILWLPPFDAIRPSVDHSSSASDLITKIKGDGRVHEGIFNHPIMVLNQSNEQIDFVVFTTLQNKTLTEWAWDSSQYGFFVPTSSERRHPFTDALYKPITLQDGSFFGRPGYLRLNNIFRIDRKYVWRVRDDSESSVRKFVLSNRSIKRVLALVRRFHGDYADTGEMPPLAAPLIPAVQEFAHLLSGSQAPLTLPPQDQSGPSLAAPLGPAVEDSQAPFTVPLRNDPVCFEQSRAMPVASRAAVFPERWTLTTERQPLLPGPPSYVRPASPPRRPWWLFLCFAGLGSIGYILYRAYMK